MKFLILCSLLAITAVAAVAAKRQPSSGQSCQFFLGNSYSISVAGTTYVSISNVAPLADKEALARTAASLAQAGVCTF